MTNPPGSRVTGPHFPACSAPRAASSRADPRELRLPEGSAPILRLFLRGANEKAGFTVPARGEVVAGNGRTSDWKVRER